MNLIKLLNKKTPVDKFLDITIINLELPVILIIIALIISLFTFIEWVDFAQPLTKEQVAAAMYSNSEIWNTSVRRICFRKGGDAGEIGYYFVELDPTGYAVVPNDARLYPLYDFNLTRKVSFVDYYKIKRKPGYGWGPPRFDNDLELQFTTLKNKLLNRKNDNQLFWEKFKK